jgi:IPT/TIG domain
MADEHGAVPPPGNPGQRALGAMESAVRRARETTGVPPLPPPARPAPAPRDRPPARPLDVAPSTTTEARETRPDRWLVGSIAVVAALVVAAAIALIVSLTGSSAPPAPTASGVTHGSVAPPPSHSPSTGARGGATTSTTTSTTTTGSSTAPVVPGGPPVISSLSPSSGAAGQSVTVAGSNLLSASGQIVATFNGQVAPTSCPAPNTCTVTVPPSTASSAQVVITTSAGTSNAVTFTYS